MSYPDPSHAQLVLAATDAIHAVANDPRADAATRKQSLAAIGDTVERLRDEIVVEESK